MNGVLVSVIIPVYNGAAYLEECIRSVQQQDLKEIEIIVVNDGSTDDSKRIAESLIATDPRIIFIDGPNEGVSAARNKGLKIAKGEFIGFVDADDTIEKGMYAAMYQQAKNDATDWVFCNVNVISGEQPPHSRLRLKNEVIAVQNNTDEIMRNLLRFRYDYATWNKLYSTKRIREHGLLFLENMSVWEDLLFNCCYLMYASGISILENNFYRYRIHATSVMNEKKFDEVDQYNTLYRSFHSFCSGKQLNQGLATFDVELRRVLYFAVIPRLFNRANTIGRSASEKRSSFLSSLRRIDKGLFNYTSVEYGKGFSVIQKKILKNGYLGLYAAIRFLKK